VAAAQACAASHNLPGSAHLLASCGVVKKLSNVFSEFSRFDFPIWN